MANFLAAAERAARVENVDYMNMAVPLESIESFFKPSPVNVWRDQPSVRKVVDFIASNIASIPLHLYDRTDDGRERVRDSDLARLLHSPSMAREENAYLFWKRVLIDWLIYDRAAVHIDPLEMKLRRIPPASWVQSIDDVYGTIKTIKVVNERGQYVTRDIDEFLILSGYSIPGVAGFSPMETLSAILTDSDDALKFRRMMWQRQATHTGVVEREQAWDSLEARKNFLEGLRAFDAKSERSGGSMLLDEGMKWKDRKPSFTPRDLDDIEARRLTDIEVASLFHIAPEMVGARQGNYSNMEAFRQSLYRDNLGPYIDGWEQAVAPLVDVFGEPGQYIEAFLDAKLRGSFEEQAKTFQTSVGAPVMTRNEARAKMNLPDVPGGDDLVTPLNVLIGGQASPQDSGTQNERAKPVQVKAPAPVESWEYTPEIGQATSLVLAKTFERQSKAVLPVIGKATETVGGFPEWWDGLRWNRELADDLYKIAVQYSPEIGRAQTEALGVDPSEYVPELTYAYLKQVSRSRAALINAKTVEALQFALAEGVAPADVFKEAIDVRSVVAGAAFAAFVASWTAKEVGQQILGGQGWKQWHVTSGNPRDSHAAMDGETVPYGARFSNGQSWPGDSSAGVDETAGCMCGVSIGRGPQ
ncbi:phage portal protein [Actinomycetaceae bacterium WB03_NA08]|uniref:Phage portal protein n=1 Tax=Scrofimicrobium canadense TaxID=2652290 RepID=A0A6N7W4Z6_9ACTO|nr:phage portal protein [Scrofimicrobium canadense]MSS84491.1 phage portal protein [Scrofimicrobium canadense]